MFKHFFPANLPASEERVADANEEEAHLGRGEHEEEAEQGAGRREGVRTLRRQAPNFAEPPHPPPTPRRFHQPEKRGKPGYRVIV